MISFKAGCGWWKEEEGGGSRCVTTTLLSATLTVFEYGLKSCRADRSSQIW